MLPSQVNLASFFYFRLFRLLLDFMHDDLDEIRHVAVESVCFICASSGNMSLSDVNVVRITCALLLCTTFSVLFVFHTVFLRPQAHCVAMAEIGFLRKVADRGSDHKKK